jgi:hypothetical protein
MGHETPKHRDRGCVHFAEGKSTVDQIALNRLVGPALFATPLNRLAQICHY